MAKQTQNKKGSIIASKAPEMEQPDPELGKTVSEPPGGIVGQTNGIVEPANKSILQLLAEMLYFSDYGFDLPYEQASEGPRSICLHKATQAIEALDKLNFMIVPKRDLNAERMANKQMIMDVLRTFFENMSAPKNLQNVVPIEELAIRIMEGRLQ